MDRVDIVVRAKDGHDLTGRCLASIRQLPPPCQSNLRVVLVDDGSAPAYPQDAADVVLRHPQSRGAVSATNTGLGHCLDNDPAPWLLVLDNDTELPAGDVDIFERWQAEFDGERVGACGATTNFANPPQHILTVPQTYTTDWQDKREGRGGRQANPQVPVFVSFAVMMRREAVLETGAWDERYDPGNYEDTDYAIALRTLGWQVKVARSVYVHHRGHQTFGDDLKRLLQTNQAKFVQKWGPGRLWDMGALADGAMLQIVQARQKAMGAA